MKTDLNDTEFDQAISLRDAYRCMEAFTAAYVARGDGAVSEFLDFYVSTAVDGLAQHSDAPRDFLNALASIRVADRQKQT